MTSKPPLFIFTGAHEATGALIAACHEAQILGEDARVSIILSKRSRIVSSGLLGNPDLMRLPMAEFGRRPGTMILYPFQLLRSGWSLHRALKRARCERLQINDFFFAEGFVLRLLGYRGRIVTWIRIDPARYGLVGRLWLKMANWSANRLVSVSLFIKRQLPSEYETVVAYDPVPPVEPISQAAGQRLLFLGNYTEGKGQDAAISAFHLIAAGFPEAELIFHGSDMGMAKNRAYRDRLVRLANEGEGRRRIHLLDFLSDPAPAYREAFAALNFSRSESFSLTCLEAGAYGLPVIATRSGGPDEIIEDCGSGFLVPVGDVDAMAARMADLLSDPNRAARMVKRGTALVNERFDRGRFRSQMLDILDLR
jgi:glycosyltransferase involved in cell wall biosynthesis